MYRKDHIMKSPKLLPWLANKAGIPPQRADLLWQAAERHAARVTGITETEATAPTAATSSAVSVYWAAAMDRLYELIAAESLREDVASFGWRRWTRLYNAIWQAPLDVLDALAVNSLRGWRHRQHLPPLPFG